MHNYNKEIGQYGENLASSYLLNIGYKLLNRNYKCKLGEIDIICLDKKYVVFIEVKTRYNINYGRPSESVNTKKQFKIFKAAQYYIQEKKLFNSYFRFDVVEVFLNSGIEEPMINLFKDAFQIY